MERRLLAVFTLHTVPDEKERDNDLPFLPDRSYATLTIFELEKPSINLGQRIERDCVMETEFSLLLQEKSNIIATKIFNDDRDLNVIVAKLEHKFGGQGLHGKGGVRYGTNFRVTTIDLVLRDFFKVK